MLLLASTLSFAQPWSGIVDPSRAIDWTTAGVTGGIPARTTICQTMTSANTAAQIQTALTNCGSAHTSEPGGIVFLSAGNYTLTNGFTIPSHVTLRGAGGGQTNLTFNGAAGSWGTNTYWGASIIQTSGGFTGGFEGSPPGPSGSNNCTGTIATTPSNGTYTGCTQLRQWTGTNGSSGIYTKGATVLNLSSAPTGLNIGDTLQLVQTNGFPPMPSSGPYICQDTAMSNACSREGDGSNDAETGLRQNVQVIGISGSTVTIASPGIFTDIWNSTNNPVAYWWSSATVLAGIENLTIISNVTGGPWGIVDFYESGDSWISGVGIHGASGTCHGIIMHMSRNITVQNNWLDAMSGGGCGTTTSYGIDTFGSTGSLIQNNILYNIESPIITQAGDAGSVYAYNYDPAVCSPVTGCTGIMLGHDAGGGYTLFEGNSGPLLRVDTFHGNELFWTMFRNRFTGSEPNSGTNNAEPTVDLYTGSRYYNAIGNVLGSSTSTIYECSNSTMTGCDRYGPSIFRLGYPGANATTSPECESSSCVAPDAQVKTTSMRWGNYDTVNAAVRFVSGEVPSGVSPYGNAVPASQNLPASFYLSLEPKSWWGTPYGIPPWPAVGPDVSNGNVSGVGGHAYMIPAQLCYQNTANYAAFNATTCYTSASIPGIPGFMGCCALPPR